QNDLPEGVPAIAVRSSVETASMVGIKQTWRACIHKLQFVLQLTDLMELDENEMIGVRLTAPRIADRPGSGLHGTVSRHGTGTRLPARLGGGSGIGDQVVETLGVAGLGHRGIVPCVGKPHPVVVVTGESTDRRRGGEGIY